MNTELIAAMQQVVDQYIDNELEHYEDNDEPDNHIYLALKKMQTWLEAQDQTEG